MRFNSYGAKVRPTTIGAYGKVSGDSNAYGGNGSGWKGLGDKFLTAAQKEQKWKQSVKDFEEDIRRRAAMMEYDRLYGENGLMNKEPVTTLEEVVPEDVVVDEIVASGGDLSPYQFIKYRHSKDLSGYKMMLSGKVKRREAGELQLSNNDLLGNNAVNYKLENQVDVVQASEGSVGNLAGVDQGSQGYLGSNHSSKDVVNGYNLEYNNFDDLDKLYKQQDYKSPLNNVTEKTYNINMGETEESFAVTVSKYEGYGQRTKREGEFVYTKDGFFKVINGEDTYIEDVPPDTIFWVQDDNNPKYGHYYAKGGGTFAKDTYLDGFAECKIGDDSLIFPNVSSLEDQELKARIEEYSSGMIWFGQRTKHWKRAENVLKLIEKLTD